MITFRPNCTLPTGPHSGFVHAANVRSTMEIVWSCIGIIILSTWSILHPNIPPDFREQDKWQFCSQRLFLIAQKALWMVVMFIAPEALISIYAHKIFCAKYNHEILKRLAEGQEVPWSRTHTVFTDMGGFAIYFSAAEDRIQFVHHFDLKQILFFSWFGEIQWNIYEEHESIAHSIRKTLSDDEAAHWKLQNLAALSGDIWVLDSAQLIAAVKGGIVKLPKITEKELKDRNKSDALVKFLAIMQVLWLITQLAARKYSDLASTPLELSTAALSASTIILYILEWNKPKDVNVPIYIPANKLSKFRKTFKEVFQAAPYPYLRVPIIPTKLYQIPSFWIQTGFIAVISILSFGGIHLFAWNFDFPTNIEQFLWRVCAVAATFLPLPYIATHYTFMKRGVNIGKKQRRVMRTYQAVFALFYVLARLFLITESVRSIYFLPPEAFKSTWSVNFPHWG
ncbi:hypothetical protein V8C42DRAFT_350088 [Trichoderma barbatum]